EGPILSLGEPVHYTSSVGQTHFLSIVWWSLCLLRIRTLNFVSGRTQIPELSPVEIVLRIVELKGRIVGCIGVPLWFPFTEPKVKRAGIGDGCRIQRRNRPAKAGIWHMAESTRHILIDGEILIELFEFTEDLHLPFRRTRIDRQCPPLRESFVF